MDFRRGVSAVSNEREIAAKVSPGAGAGGFGHGGGGMGPRPGERDALLQEQGGGSQLEVGQEAALHRLAVEQMVERQQAHAAVVRHPGADDGEGFAGGHAGGGVVHRFVEPEAADDAVVGQPPEIADGRFGFDHQGHRGGIGRHDEIVGEAALHAEHRDAERAVLVDVAMASSWL
jgi:hypothetical protein